MTHPVFNKLDPEVIARVKAGIRHEHKPVKKLKPRRHAKAYRAARRNAVLRGSKSYIWEGVRPRRGGVRDRTETYLPNGERERARRARQIAAGQLRAENGRVA